jgi:protein TonB
MKRAFWVAIGGGMLLAAGCAPGDKSRPAAPLRLPADLLNNRDYPLAALRFEEEGMTRFRLAVSAAGLVSDCAIAQSSGSATLDVATCRLLSARLRFKPATDRRGRPVAGRYEGRVLWRLPEK